MLNLGMYIAKKITKTALMSFTFLTPYSLYLYFIPGETVFFPRPTGPYGVGTVVYELKDIKRQEQYATKASNSSRQLVTHIWYPTDQQKPDSPEYLYSNLLASNYFRGSNITPVFDYFSRLLTTAKKAYCYSVLNAPLSKRESSYPIILFSHGLASFATSNTIQCEELASHGYIVVGISHTYYSALTSFPHGKNVYLKPNLFLKGLSKKGHKQLQYMDDSLETWVADAQRILDYLEVLNKEENNSPFFQKLDMSKIGMFGHSFGGATAVQVGRRDHRCKAVIDMDGPLFGKKHASQVNVPLLFLLSENFINGIAKARKGVFKTIAPRFTPAIQDLFEKTESDFYKVIIKGASHMTFTDWVYMMRDTLINKHAKSFPLVSIGSIESKKAAAIINEYVLQFFDKYLKMKPSLLLDGNDQKFAEHVVFNKKIKS